MQSVGGQMSWSERVEAIWKLGEGWAELETKPPAPLQPQYELHTAQLRRLSNSAPNEISSISYHNFDYRLKLFIWHERIPAILCCGWNRRGVWSLELSRCGTAEFPTWNRLGAKIDAKLPLFFPYHVPAQKMPPPSVGSDRLDSRSIDNHASRSIIDNYW
jgi:hypothetical protein